MLTYPEINRAMRAGATGGGNGGDSGTARFGRGQVWRAPEGDGGGGGAITPAGGTHDQQLNATVNAAVSSQIERKLNAAIEKLPLQQLISQGIANALPTALEGVTSKLTETLGAQIAKLGPQQGEQQQQGGAGGKAGKGQPDEALIKFQTQLDEMKSKLEDKDRQLAAQAAEQAERSLADGARAALLKAGVKEPMVDAAIALHRQRGTFKQDKDGAHVVAKRKSSHGEYTERLDLDRFAAEWVASDEGKHYVPAAAPAGRNGRRGVDQIVGGGAGGGERVLRGGQQQQGAERQQSASDRHTEDVAIGEALIDHLLGTPA